MTCVQHFTNVIFQSETTKNESHFLSPWMGSVCQFSVNQVYVSQKIHCLWQSCGGEYQKLRSGQYMWVEVELCVGV